MDFKYRLVSCYRFEFLLTRQMRYSVDVSARYRVFSFRAKVFGFSVSLSLSLSLSLSVSRRVSFLFVHFSAISRPLTSVSAQWRAAS